MLALSRAFAVSSTAAMVAVEERQIVGVRNRQFVLDFSCVVSQCIRPEGLNYETNKLWWGFMRGCLTLICQALTISMSIEARAHEDLMEASTKCFGQYSEELRISKSLLT